MSLKSLTIPPFAIVLAALGYVWSRFDLLPDRYPIHWGLHGADRWVDKSPAVVLLPGLAGLLVLTMMAAKVWRRDPVPASQARSVRGQLAMQWLIGFVIAAVLLLPLYSS